MFSLGTLLSAHVGETFSSKRSVPLDVQRMTPGNELLQITKAVFPLVVTLKDPNGKILYASGNGSLVNATKGLILSSAHLVDQHENYSVASVSIFIKDPSGDPRELKCNVEKIDTVNDLALLQINDYENLNPAYAQLSLASGELNEDQQVFLLGHLSPPNHSPQVSIGHIINRQELRVKAEELKEAALMSPGLTDESLEPLTNFLDFINKLVKSAQLSFCDNNPGLSGSPLLDDTGKVIGVHSAAAHGSTRASNSPFYIASVLLEKNFSPDSVMGLSVSTNIHTIRNFLNISKS